MPWIQKRAECQFNVYLSTDSNICQQYRAISRVLENLERKMRFYFVHELTE